MIPMLFFMYQFYFPTRKVSTVLRNVHGFVHEFDRRKIRRKIKRILERRKGKYYTEQTANKKEVWKWHRSQRT